MAFTPSYNILDKDTHNTLVDALKSGGIGYTEADGTVHKISDTYASGGGSSLPEVSADDNGDVLTVVEGAWAKAAPSGGGGGFDFAIETTRDGMGGVTFTLKSGTYTQIRAKILVGQFVCGIIYLASPINDSGETGMEYSQMSLATTIFAVNESDGVGVSTASLDLIINPDGSVIERQ